MDSISLKYIPTKQHFANSPGLELPNGLTFVSFIEPNCHKNLAWNQKYLENLRKYLANKYGTFVTVLAEQYWNQCLFLWTNKDVTLGFYSTN